MKKLMIILLLLLPMCLGHAEDVHEYRSGDWIYTLEENGTAAIWEYTGRDEHVGIPAELDGHPVAAVRSGAFYAHASLTSVVIPDSVVSLDIGAFDACSSLTAFLISPDHPVYAAIDGVLFSRADRTLLLYPAGLAADTYAVPQGIQTVGDYAFYGVTGLRTLLLPDSVTAIAPFACCECTSLTSVSFPPGLISIGDSAFAACTALTDVHFPESLVFIGSHAFMGCQSLRSVVIPGGIPVLQDYTFCHCASLESVIIGEGVSTVGAYAFWDCASLRSITLPDSLLYFQSSAANECPLLESIVLSPEHPVFAVINGALYSREDASLLLVPCGLPLTELLVEEGTVSIGEYAILGCSSLTSIRLPESLVSIEQYGVAMCSSLESIVIPAGVVSLGDWVLFSCEKLHSVTLLGDVPLIGRNVFAYAAPDLVVTLPRDSLARQWCIDNSVMYTYPDADSWLSP